MANRSFETLCRGELMSFAQFMNYTHMTLRGTPSEKARYLFNFISGNKPRFYFRDLLDFYKTLTSGDTSDLLHSRPPVPEDKEEADWLTMARLTWGVMDKSEAVTKEASPNPHLLVDTANRLRNTRFNNADSVVPRSSSPRTAFGSEHLGLNRVQSINDFDPNPVERDRIESNQDLRAQPPESEDTFVTCEEFERLILKSPFYAELFNFFHDRSRSLLSSIHSGRPYYEMLARLDNMEQLLENLEYIIVYDDKTIDLQGSHRFTTKFYNAFIKMLNNQQIQQRSDPRIPQAARRTLEGVMLANRGSSAARAFPNDRHHLMAHLNMVHLLNKTAEQFTELTMKNESETTGKMAEDVNDISVGTEEVEEEINLPNPTLRPDDANRDLANLRLNMFKSVRVRLRQLKALVKTQLDKIMEQKVLSRNLLGKEKFKQQAGTANKKEVFVNNKNWNIVTSMINGIQKSLLMAVNDRDHSLTLLDFKMHNKLEMEAIFSTAFDRIKFKDFAPRVFLNLRRLFGISNDSYMKSLGVDTFANAFFDRLMLMLSEHSSGKSGAILFHTADGKFLVKSVHKKEFELLRVILRDYYGYLQKQPQTLLTRYFGLHEIKCYNKTQLVMDIFVVVMNNVFDLAQPRDIKDKFDLKGSTFGRWTQPEDSSVKGAAKKDNNFIDEQATMRLPATIYHKLIAQVQRDSEFLAQKNIIDYSLLVGSIAASRDLNVRPMFAPTEVSAGEGRRQSFVESADNELHFYVGIIDTLTEFDLKKKSEWAVKRVFQGSGISCLPPSDYQRRFSDFVQKTVFQPAEADGHLFP